MRIYENALGKNSFGMIKGVIPSIPWYVTTTAWSGDERVPGLYDYSFAHKVFEFHENEPSYLQPLFYPLVCAMLESIGEKFDVILRLRLALQTPMSKEYTNFPHVDRAMNHRAGLLYLEESDGDTVFYDKRYDLDSPLDPIQYIQRCYDDGESIGEIDRVKPEENKLVLFDGLTYHASSKPMNYSTRIVLNINYE